MEGETVTRLLRKFTLLQTILTGDVAALRDVIRMFPSVYRDEAFVTDHRAHLRHFCDAESRGVTCNFLRNCTDLSLSLAIQANPISNSTYRSSTVSFATWKK